MSYKLLSSLKQLCLFAFTPIWPDEEHVAGRSSERDDEGRDDRESQEVREHPVAVVLLGALTRMSREVTSHTDTAAVGEDLVTHTHEC